MCHLRALLITIGHFQRVEAEALSQSFALNLTQKITFYPLTLSSQNRLRVIVLWSFEGDRVVGIKNVVKFE